MADSPEDQKSKEETGEPVGVHREVLRQTVMLATGALGLIAALAWNDAVRALFDRIFGTAGGIAVKFGYAVLVTVIVVVISVRLQRAVLQKK
jgi:ABC-type Mn2+/Zn2+ transport system permease subunit